METIRRLVPQKAVDYSIVTILTVGGLWSTGKIVAAISNYLARKRMLEKWKVTPTDVVIIHTLPRGKTSPSVSPYVIKLETFLRMHNIPYQMDFEYAFGPKGKTPWITLNGEHMADSQLIIEHLSTKFVTELSNYTDEQLAIGRTVRIMMEEYFYCGLGLWRYVYSEGKGLSEILDLPPNKIKIFYKQVNARVKIASFYQGIGRHNQEDVIEIMKKNLKTVSKIIGTKKFLLGEEPSEADCAVFGFLAQVVYCAPNSPYEILVEEELVNLKEYCIRMKETFWPDWEKCLAGVGKQLVD